MKRNLSIAIAVMMLNLAIEVQSQAQNLVQPLSVSLSAYKTGSSRPLRIGTKELIQYLAGTNVPNGHLYLVTPPGNAPGLTGNLNAFLRITRGTTTVLEITSPDQFNFFQDVAVLSTNAATITARAINRFSIDSGSVRAELQGISTWVISRASAHGAELSGAGSFQCSLNGWIGIYNVTEADVPVSGSISATRANPGP